MVRSSLALAGLMIAAACGTDEAPAAPAPTAAPRGKHTLEVQASLTALSTLDAKSRAAEDECAKAREAARAGASEPDLSKLIAPLEHACRVIDAWAVLGRALPPLDGKARADTCATLGAQLEKMSADGIEISSLRLERDRACRVPEPFVPTGELARVGKLDPHGKAAISLCRDARTEAYQVMIRDRLAGREREKVLDVICAAPDLFGNLEIAASKDKPADAREAACISARVWSRALAKSKRLKGKPLSLAQSGLKKACKKWLKVDPMAELGKLAKLDPKSKDARGLCARAATYVTATETSGGKADLGEGRDKTCAVVEAWALALDGPCATAADRLEAKRSLVGDADYEAMRAEQKDRCK